MSVCRNWRRNRIGYARLSNLVLGLGSGFHLSCRFGLERRLVEGTYKNGLTVQYK